MQDATLEPKDCLNWATCGRAQEYTPEEEIELIRIRVESRRRIQEYLRVTRHAAALMMLHDRGCAQSVADFGTTAQIDDLRSQLSALSEHLQTYEEGYIAPAGVFAHAYNVKRPSYVIENENGEKEQTWNVYWYNKLTATERIFEPAAEEDRVRVIHLSHNDDPRNIEGRLGIERRERLKMVNTRLKAAKSLIDEAMAIATAPMTDVLVNGQELES